MSEKNHLDLLAIIVIGVIIYIFLKNVVFKTKIVEIVRDEQGRIVSIVEKYV